MKSWLECSAAVTGGPQRLLQLCIDRMSTLKDLPESKATIASRQDYPALP